MVVCLSGQRYTPRKRVKVEISSVGSNPFATAFNSNQINLAEDKGFEPLRDCSQPAFQASAIGH